MAQESQPNELLDTKGIRQTEEASSWEIFIKMNGLENELKMRNVERDGLAGRLHRVRISTSQPDHRRDGGMRISVR